MSDLGLHGHASVALRGPIHALDENTVVFGCGSGVALFATDATGTGRHDAVWPSEVGSSITAYCTIPLQQRLVVASQRPPTVTVLTAAKEPVVRLTAPSDTPLDLMVVAASRSGSRVAAFGDNRLFVWDAASGALLASAASTAPVTAASFNPADKHEIAATGPEGVTVWQLVKAFDAWTLESVSGVVMASGGDSPSAPPPEVAAAHNLITCHAWERGSTLLVANSVGNIVRFDPETATPGATYPAAAGGVAVTTLVVTAGHVVAGCEDAAVRWLRADTLEVEREEAVRPRQRGPDASASLAVASMCASPQYSRLFVHAAAGSLHAVGLASDVAGEGKDADLDADRLQVLHETHPGPVVSMAVLPRTSAATPFLATVCADRRLRVWDYAKRRLVCQRRFVAGSVLTASAKAHAAGSTDNDGGDGGGAGAPGGPTADAAAADGGVAGSRDAAGAQGDANVGDDSLTAPDGGGHQDVALLTVVAAHPRLPLLAVGSADGYVRFVVVAPNGSATPTSPDVLKSLAAGPVAEEPLATPVTLLSSWVHDGAVSAAAFCSHSSTPFVATCSADERRVYVHDIRVALPPTDGSATSATDGSHGFPLVAYANLPQGDARTATSLFWRGDADAVEVCIVLESGEILSMPGPPAVAGELTREVADDGSPLPYPPPRDMTTQVRLRGRLHAPVTDVACVSWGVGDFGYASSPADKSLLVVGLGWAPGDTAGGHSVADTHEPPIQRFMPLASLPCHAKGVTCVARSPVTPASKDAPVILATGGADGGVGVLAVKGKDVVRKVVIPVHATSVSSVSFTRDGRFVLSTGLDGAVHVLSVSGQLLEAASGGRLLAGGGTAAAHVDKPAGDEALVLTTYMAIAQAIGPVGTVGLPPADDAPSADDAPAHDAHMLAEGVEEDSVRLPDATTPAHVRIAAQVAAAEAAEAAEAKEAARAELRTLTRQLQALLAANERATDLEKLDREEFVVDVEGRDAIRAEFDQAAAATAARIDDENTRREIVTRRIVEECWDSMEVTATCVRAFLTDGVVHNFPIRRQTAAELARLRRLVQLRRVEMMDLADSREASHGVWRGLLDEIPSDADWILNCGLLPPTLDPLNLRQSKEEDAEDSKGDDDDLEAGGEDDEDEDDADDDEEEAAEFDPKVVLKLLYHPAAVRTPNQRRTQAALLQVLVREVQRKFNASVHDLAMLKLDSMDKIEGKNKRIREIRAELQEDVEYFEPSLADDEEPERVLTVADDAVGVEKYIPEEERARQEAERARREAADAANRDDAPERALNEMMGGTLEAKDELAMLEDELVREDWMDQLSLEEMTDEQRSELEEFEAKQKAVRDEKARHRKALELELKKLKAEVKDVCKHFDDQVATAFSNSLTVQLYTSAQELTAVRLAMSVQDREESFRQDRLLEDRMAEYLEKEEIASSLHDEFAARCDVQERKVQDMLRADREMERSVREQVKEAGGPLDADVLRLLVQLFKRRAQSDRPLHSGLSKAHDGPAAGAGASATPAAVSDPFRDAVDVDTTAEDVAAKQAALAASMKPLSKLDCPEAFDPDEFPAAWARMNELRQHKIQHEAQLVDEQATLTEMRNHLAWLKGNLDRIRDDIETTEQRREDLMQARETMGANLELMIRLKQGQDEMDAEAVATDYSKAVLVPRGIVKTINSKIEKLGGERVSILTKIKDFRKSINFMEWEHQYMKAQAHDCEEHYTDLHMLRVTKELQHFIKGGDMALKQRKDLDKLEAKGEHLKKAHSRTVGKLQRQSDRLMGQVKEREAENRRLEAKRRELEESVAMRQSIKATRTTGADPVDAATRAKQRMKAVVTRRKLVDLAKAQTEEIDFLRKELDRLRQRTFPSFAHMVESRGNVDQRM